jgi:hypothetical protein
VRGTLDPVLDTYEVDFFPVGGHGSTTRVHELAEQATPARPLVILYLGGLRPKRAPHERGGSAASARVPCTPGAGGRHAGGVASLVERAGGPLPRRRGPRVPAACADPRGHADPRPPGELPGLGRPAPAGPSVGRLPGPPRVPTAGQPKADAARAICGRVRRLRGPITRDRLAAPGLVGDGPRRIG